MALRSAMFHPLILHGLLLGMLSGCEERIQHGAGADGGRRGGVNPGACGGAPFPDAHVTGHAPTGVQLAAYTGPSRISAAGTIIDGADISACLTIAAADVVLRRSRLRSTERCGLGLIEVLPSAAGLRLEDVELDGVGAGSYGITGGGFSAVRLDVHGFNGGLAIGGAGPTVLEDSWVHDLTMEGPVPVDSVSSNGASGVILRGNNLENLFNSDSAIGLFGDYAPIEDFLVERNLLNGGGYVVYAGYHPTKDYPDTSDIRFEDNCFGRKFFAQGGYFGPVSAFQAGARGNVWRGNRWQDTGSEVVP